MIRTKILGLGSYVPERVITNEEIPYLNDQHVRQDTVQIETDVRRQDQYQRTLAYVWLADGRMANEVLARRIMDLAKAGEHDPERLQSAALKFFRH